MTRMRFTWLSLILGAGIGLGILTIGDAGAQQMDMTRGGPIEITASEGLEWHQNEQQVVARGNARAVRGAVTVTADRLIAYYRKKTPTGGAAGGAAAPSATPPQAAAPAVTPLPATPTDAPTRRRARPAAAPAGSPSLFGGGDSGSNEIYRVEAIGNVHIYTATDQVWGDRAIYDIDQAVMLMTGRNLKLSTPTQVLTARDSLEYWPQLRMAVARGNAVAVTSDAKRVAADTLVAFTKEDNAARGATPPTNAQTNGKPGARNDPTQAGSGKLQRVEAFGNVSIQTPTELVTGTRGIYVADTGLARLGGNVRITRGQNQMNGSDAEVNMNTGVSRLLAGTTGRVTGLVVPNDPSNQGMADALGGTPSTGTPGTGTTARKPPGAPASTPPITLGSRSSRRRAAQPEAAPGATP